MLQSLNANTDVFQRGRVVKLIKRLGQYSFSQLVDWQGRIGHGSNLEDEITLLDADESLNRVHLYVRSSDALSRVAALADRVGVPPEAIVAQVHDWHIHTTADSTRGVVRPTSGGLEISHPDSVIFNGVHAYGNVVCSLGYNVTVNGVDYLLTAAHCNKHHYLGTTGDPMYQPDSARAPTPIGTTAINPAWASSPLCSGYQYCNDVDAMLVQYGSTAHNKTVIQTTTIGVGTAGSRTIGSYLSLAIPSPLERMQGDSVYKTGYWTGTTGGTVGGSCTQAPDKSGYFLVWCTNFAVLYNDGGDSGGPVFYFKFPLALDVRMGLTRFDGRLTRPNLGAEVVHEIEQEGGAA